MTNEITLSKTQKIKIDDNNFSIDNKNKVIILLRETQGTAKEQMDKIRIGELIKELQGEIDFMKNEVEQELTYAISQGVKK